MPYAWFTETHTVIQYAFPYIIEESHFLKLFPE